MIDASDFLDYASVSGTEMFEELIRSRKPIAISSPESGMLILVGLYDVGDQESVRLDIGDQTILFHANGAREFACLMLQLADALEPRRNQ